MSEGYTVNVDQLTEAGRSIVDLVKQVAEQPTDGLDPSEADLGHAELAAAAEEFFDRWSRGLNSLLQDAGTIAVNLHETAEAYRQAEQEAVNNLGGDQP
ncbi:hypothetical protein [Actinokineospora bangkokensis]|uniref:hypothetical protein n=1 Tax=Actinokineospora bangkokensis TaxID=1193682 RepID=UPI0011786EA2|nr:hypothetical protein [Actinokineospora bangkokensis]